MAMTNLDNGIQALQEDNVQLRRVLKRLIKSFPADTDLAEAGWSAVEVAEAMDAYDAARRLVSQSE